MKTPTVVIHGGAGSAVGGDSREEKIRRRLEAILERLWEEAQAGASAMELVEMGGVELEDCPHFNAGRGSKLQSDGRVRMSATIMDGRRRAFSGVVNVEKVKNPTVMAAALQQERDRVLDGQGAGELARQMKLPVFDPIVERRLQQWWQTRRENGGEDCEQEAQPEEASELRGTGTVGVVARDGKGRLAASTSTGGRGFERIGRVSDTATVAGNYATEQAAVSCTGVGEDIVDEALAARIVVKVEEGMELEAAVETSMDDARSRDRRFGIIAVDRQGAMQWAKTTEVLLAVGRCGDEVRWAF